MPFFSQTFTNNVFFVLNLVKILAYIIRKGSAELFGTPFDGWQ